MSISIMNLNERYNIFSSVTDDVYFENSLSFNQLKKFYKNMYGNSELTRSFPRQLRISNEKGTSSRIFDSLSSQIKSNRSGNNESRMGIKEFKSRFLSADSCYTDSEFDKFLDAFDAEAESELEELMK